MTAELLSVLIVIFLFICILFVIAVIITEIPKFLIGVFASIFLICVCICMLLNKKSHLNYIKKKLRLLKRQTRSWKSFL